MADFGATELDTFRAETRAWLEANYPASLNAPMTSEDETPWGGRKANYPNPDIQVWMDRMAAKGWTAPMWPAAYGGGGLSKDQNRVLESELRRIKARPALSSFGIWMLGPVLLEYATEEQKQRFLPDIIKGKTRWCQGYSEPGAGSDLAGLQTRCEDQGDHYLINGQKVWTSYADQADWIFCLVRTDTSKKHEGISFVLFDMTSPGVETRPIKLISGSSPFCETFFTDVKVPKDQLFGPLNGGWTIAKRLLQHERDGIGASLGSGNIGAGSAMPTVLDAAKAGAGLDADGRLSDPDLRRRVTEHLMENRAFQLTVRRQQDEARSGNGPSNLAAAMKYAGAKIAQDRNELVVESLGMQGLGWEGPGFEAGGLAAMRSMLRSKANSIEGGSSEINLNVVSKRVLGLPDPK
jgi:alkylation response protein AidB-like acyl-CoA dehydrogenase